MSVSGRCRNALLVLAFGAAGTALAAEAEEPEMEFVEYLGLWEASDEEWLMVEHQMAMESEEERIDPVPDGEESREDDDEG